MRMYSDLSRGVLKYMLEMFMPIHLAFRVEMDFDGLKASGVGASLTWVVSYEVSTSWYSSLIRIVFFRSAGAQGESIGESATARNLVFVDEEDGADAFGIAGRKSLS